MLHRKPCPRRACRLGLALAAALAASSSMPGAGEIAPLPPPAELLDGQGYAIDNAVPAAPAAAPRGAWQTGLAAEAGPRPGPVRVSPPAATMPAEYFDLPLVEAGIPGVLLPELDEHFVDPGLEQVRGRRPITPGMTEEQLQPYFEEAKRSERAALEAKKYGDEQLYRRNLDRAIQQYTEVIAMADAATEAREEAWYGVARCEYRRENWWRAFDALERSFPSKYDREEVLGRIRLEMFIGERLWRLGHAPAPDARKDGTTMPGYQAAARVYTAVLLNNPGSRDAPLALLRRGDAAALEEDWPEAAKFYRSVVQYYPESEAAMQARSSLAEAVYRQEWPAGFPEAGRQELSAVMREVETAERKLSTEAEERKKRAVELANEEEAGTMLRQAREYLSSLRVKKSRDAAVFLLGEVVSHYPGTAQAEEAAELLVSMGIEPPMVLSDGTRFPLAGGRAPAEEEAAVAAPPGGSVQLGRQDMARPRGRPESPNALPARQSLSPTGPMEVAVPGVVPDR